MPSVNEPTVSVHGVPQSQYQSGGVPGSTPAMQQGGGIKGNIQRNWPIYTLVLGIVTIVVIIYFRNQGSGGSTSGTGGTTDPNALWGSQLDADYQQMISSLNQLIALQTGKNNSSGSGSGGNKGGNGGNKGNGGGNKSKFYTVQSGDTLSHIADTQGFASWQSLYNAFGNAQTIQNTAKSHGHTSNPQNWLYPGERLQVR